MTKAKVNTLIYFVGTIILTILNFIISLLYSNMFNPESYGSYSLVFSVYSLISQILIGWIGQATIRYYTKDLRKKMISSVLITHFFFSILIVIITNLTLLFININNNEKIMYFIFSIIFFFETFLAFVNSILRSENNSKQYSINTNLNSLLKILVLLLLYYVFGYHNIIALTISLLASEVIQTVYLFIKLKLYKSISVREYDVEVFKKMFKYGFPLIGVAITSWILNVSDRFIIDFYYDANAVGLYSYSYTLANSLVSLIMQFIMLGAYPHIVDTWNNYGKEKTEQIISNYLKLYLILIMPLCFGFGLMSKYFFEIFTNSLYHESYLNFFITSLGIAVLGLTQYTNKTWELHKKTNIILLFNIIAAILNIILNIIFIPKYGYLCGSITTLVSFIIYFIISVIFGRKKLSVKIPFIDFVKILSSCLIFSIFIITLDNILNLNNNVNFLLVVFSSVVIYFVCLIKLKTFDIKELLKK